MYLGFHLHITILNACRFQKLFNTLWYGHFIRWWEVSSMLVIQPIIVLGLVLWCFYLRIAIVGTNISHPMRQSKRPHSPSSPPPLRNLRPRPPSTKPLALASHTKKHHSRTKRKSVNTTSKAASDPVDTSTIKPEPINIPLTQFLERNFQKEISKPVSIFSSVAREYGCSLYEHTSELLATQSICIPTAADNMFDSGTTTMLVLRSSPFAYCWTYYVLIRIKHHSEFYRMSWNQ